MYHGASFSLSNLFTACSLETSWVRAALFLMAFHGLSLPGSDGSNCTMTVLCAYLLHAGESDGGHTVLLTPMDWWNSILYTLLFKWMMLTFQEVWTRKVFFDVSFMPQFEWRDGMLLVCATAFISSMWIPLPSVAAVHLYLTWPKSHIVKQLFRLNSHKSARCGFLPFFHYFWDVSDCLSSVE